MLKRRSLLGLLVILICLPLSADDGDLGEALRTAASAGDVEAVRALIAKGAEVDAANDYGATALGFAADKGHLEAVKVLVEHGADVNARDTMYQSRPIDWAAYYGHVDVVIYLLEKGSEGLDGALMGAIYRQNTEVMEAILATAELPAETLTNALTAVNRLEESPERAAMVALLEQAGAKPLPPSEFVIEPQILASYAGTYRAAEGAFEGTMAVAEGGLVATFPSTPPLPLEALDNTTFRPQGGSDFTITFQVADGRARGFQLHLPERDPIALVRVEPEATATAETEAPPAESEPPAAETETRVVEAKKPAATTSPNWPGFRGANASGVAEGYPVPTTWNGEEGVNIRWKTPLPGRAFSSPIIWGNRLFVTTAISSEGEKPFRTGNYGDADMANNLAKHSWRIYALDKRSGEILWQHEAHEGVPRSDNHIKSSQANATPTTDGKHLVAVLGSEGLFCYDLDGHLKWRRDLGALDVGWFFDPSYEWGHAASPIIYKNLVIVQTDLNRNAFIAAYALEDGRELWRTERDNLPSWGTPTLLEAKDHVEVVTNGSRWIRAYDPRSGEELWRLAPHSEVTVGTPVVGHGMVFVTGRWRPVQPIYAIRPGGRGDISLPEGADSSEYIAWSDMRAGTYVPTPIVYGDYFYTHANNGVVTCYQATTGERIYRERVGGRAGAFSASAVAADGKLFLTEEDGDIYVVKAGPSYELLATNPMGEVLIATPAISEGMIYVRSLDHLFGIGEAAPADASPEGAPR